ncbi:MAG: DNA gyrase C-terminal beta-propeller domain-containing protein [Actinomycetota bacterium]
MPDLVIVTKKGNVKRTDLRQYATHHRGTDGVIGIRLRQGDAVAGAVRVDRASDAVTVVTNKGTTLRFKAGEVPKMGRRTRGVIGLRLRRGEEIVAVVGT